MENNENATPANPETQKKAAVPPKTNRALTPEQRKALEAEIWNPSDYQSDASVFNRTQYLMNLYGSFDEAGNFSCRTEMSMREQQAMKVLAGKLNWKTAGANS